MRGERNEIPRFGIFEVDVRWTTTQAGRASQSARAIFPYTHCPIAAVRRSSQPGRFALPRGKAFLAAHRGSEAAVEFQKILDHRGLLFNEPIGALVHLQLGRAYALQGDTAQTRAGYQDSSNSGRTPTQTFPS